MKPAYWFVLIFLRRDYLLVLGSCLLLTHLVYLDMEIAATMVLKHVCSKIPVNRKVIDNLKHKEVKKLKTRRIQVQYRCNNIVLHRNRCLSAISSFTIGLIPHTN